MAQRAKNTEVRWKYYVQNVATLLRGERQKENLRFSKLKFAEAWKRNLMELDAEL